MKLKIGFFAILLGLSLLLSHSLFSLAALLAALTHELGHIITARILNIHLHECKVGLFGVGLFPEESFFSYRQEILLCISGPFVNLLFGAIVLSATESSLFWQYFAFSSLSLGILNLLPIRDFDGGRILSAVLSQRVSPHVTHRCLTLLSFLCVLFLWTLSVYLLLRAASSLSLFIFSLSLFCRIFIPSS